MWATLHFFISVLQSKIIIKQLSNYLNKNCNRKYFVCLVSCYIFLLDVIDKCFDETSNGWQCKFESCLTALIVLPLIRANWVTCDVKHRI